MSVITCRSNVLRGTRSVPRNLATETEYHYVGGTSGSWQVTEMIAHRGPPLNRVSHIDIIKGPLNAPATGADWVLSGLVRSTRYISREDCTEIIDHDTPTDRPRAALIAVRRSDAWWDLGDMALREMLETQSYLLSTGLKYLSGIMARWQPRRNVSDEFDVVTWFEYESQDTPAFDDMISAWRASEEWKYVERECEMRLLWTGS